LGDLKLTFRKFYRISGGATQLRGVVPDIIVPDRLEYIKPLREKDNPSALSWDEISKADYNLWNSGYDINDVVKTINKELKDNSSFKLIQDDVQWLEKNVDKTYSLNLQKFRAEQKELRDKFKQMDDAVKLPSTLKVVSLKEDAARIKDDKDKEDRSKAFIKRIGDDIYIDETVKVVNDMIGEETLVKAGK
jgi:carboxyl-terminal processing protease